MSDKLQEKRLDVTYGCSKAIARVEDVDAVEQCMEEANTTKLDSKETVSRSLWLGVPIERKSMTHLRKMIPEGARKNEVLHTCVVKRIEVRKNETALDTKRSACGQQDIRRVVQSSGRMRRKKTTSMELKLCLDQPPRKIVGQRASNAAIVGTLHTATDGVGVIETEA